MTLIHRKWAILTVVCALALSSAAQAQEADKSAQIRKHFVNAVKAFESEQYDKAAEEFEKVLELSPSSADALALRDLATIRFYVNAVQKGSPKTRENVLRLLELAAEAEKQRLTDKEEIEKLVRRLSASFEERAKVYIQLIAAGRYAVPPLLQRLLDTTAADYDTYRVRASMALIRIGEEAVLPLCAALRTGSVPARHNICIILGQIGDPRAAPYLLRAAKSDPDPSVRTLADRALAMIRSYTEIPDEAPHVALFRYARLYYYNDPSIQRPSRFGDATWAWSADEKRLVMQEMPGFLYNVSMARNIAMEALLAGPDYEPVLPLLISSYYKEAARIENRLKLSKTNPDMRLSELEERQLTARLAKSRDVILTLRSAGEKHFYRALSLQLRDEDFEPAAAVIDDLAGLASPKLNVYPDLPALSEPLRPAVIKIGQALAADRPRLRLIEAPAKTEAPRPRRAKINPASLFPQLLEAEKKRLEAAAPKRPPTFKEAPPAERESLNYLIAIARRRTAARKARDVKELARKQEGREDQVAAEANPLLVALRSPDKSVRYRAAAALVRIEPTRDFAGSKAVVEILGQAMMEKSVSTALIVSADNQSANLLRQVVRAAGQTPYSAATTTAALAAARALPPKDVILVDEDMTDAFEAMKKDPVIAAIPVIVFTQDADTSTAEEAYGDKAAGVISLKARPQEIAAEIFGAMRDGLRPDKKAGLAARYAQTGARAIASIPAAGSPFSKRLAAVKDTLIAALDSDNLEVRLAATVALGRAKVKSLLPRLIDLAQAEDRTKPERLACMEAIGDMLGPGEKTPPEVVGLVKKIHKSDDAEFRRLAIERLAGAEVPPADLEKLINQQESAEEPE